MTGTDLPSLVRAAQSGGVNELVALMAPLARDLRTFIATFSASPAMTDEAFRVAWGEVRRQLAFCPVSGEAAQWVRQQSIAVLKRMLGEERNQAITAKDALRHVVAQEGIEGLDAMVSAANANAQSLGERYSGLPEDLQTLIARRYGDGAKLAEIAREQRISEVDTGIRLFTARAQLHWRASAEDARAPADRLLPGLIEQYLTWSMATEARGVLAGSMTKDLARTAAFSRQVRTHLLLGALFGPIEEQALRQLAETLVPAAKPKRNESSLLRVVAPPRAPVASVTELHRRGEASSPRRQDPPSGPRRQRGSRPKVRRAGDDEGPSSSGGRVAMIAGGAFLAIGLIALAVVWSGGSRGVQPVVPPVPVTDQTSRSETGTGKEPDAPPPVRPKTGPALFVRGIGFGGNDPVVIERNRWLSHRQALGAGLSVMPGTQIAPLLSISGPGMDFDLKAMLGNGLVGSGGAAIHITQALPDGEYDVSLWVSSASASVEGYGLVLNGKTTSTDQSAGGGPWRRLGPHRVMVSDRKLDVVLSGPPTLRLCGLALTVPGGPVPALPASVSLVSPGEASAFYIGNEVTLRADVIGSGVTKVVYRNGDEILGEATTSPYVHTFTGTKPGEYRVTASAVMAGGDTTVSLPRAFTISKAGGTGTIRWEMWEGLGGDFLADVRDMAVLERPPKRTQDMKSFDAPRNTAEEFYGRMRGWIVPPATGAYVFWIAGDDECALFISPDDKPANKQRIAGNRNSVGYGDWGKEGGQQSQPIALTEGVRYYIEAVYKEGKVDDHCTVGWKLPNGVLERPIPGAHLIPFK